MDTGSGRERTWVLAAVIVLHLLVGRWVLSWSPPGHPRDVREDEALMVEFIAPRAETSFIVSRDTAGGATPHRAVRRPPVVAPGLSGPIPSAAADARVGDGVAGTPHVERALDLTLPSPADAGSGIERSAFDRPPPVLPGRTTRFERAWTPSGDALEVASWRHPIVRGALNLFGGPPKKCSEVERRLRGLNCLTDEADFGP